jgi:hypothetical protein
MGGAIVGGSKNASVEAEERQRFLTRTGKISSFVDAPHGVFGWDFYPSNPFVKNINGSKYLFNLLFGTPKAFTIDNYLEGGARDCLVIVLVKSSRTDPIKAEVSSYYTSMNPDGFSGGENKQATEILQIPVPVVSPWEYIASLPIADPDIGDPKAKVSKPPGLLELKLDK